MPPPPRVRTGGRPVGVVTRGTTGANRLRRLDRWTVTRTAALLRRADDPLVVDLGYGASPGTTFELAARLRAVRPDVAVVGLEIEPDRVARALAAPPVAGVTFARGGFELAEDGLLAGRRPVVVRAANVLRQYSEADVPAAWARVVDRLAPGGVLLDATCDEIGRRAAWLVVGRPDDDVHAARAGGGTAAGAGRVDGPPAARALVLSLRLAGLERPGVVAERLPKALIHRNVPGEGVHAWLAALDAAWARAAPLGALGAVQRWRATCASVAAQGWPVLGPPGRWRLGEVAVDASAVR